MDPSCCYIVSYHANVYVDKHIVDHGSKCIANMLNLLQVIRGDCGKSKLAGPDGLAITDSLVFWSY